MRTWLKENKWLAIIIGGALLLRLAAIVFGLPQSDVFGDELNHTIIAFKMLEAKSPWLSFDVQAYLPPLFSYLLAPIFGLIGLVGLAFDYFKNLADFKDFVILYREWFLIPGRIISAFFGAGTAGVLYLLVERLFNKKTALLAAALLAFDFLHVHESQIGHIWSIITFFAVLTAYSLYRLYESGETRWYYWSAASIALGYAFGQIPIIFYVFFVAVCWFYSRRQSEKFFNRKFILSSLLCLAVVALFSVLNFYTLYKHFYDLAIALFKLLGLDQNILPPVPWFSAKLVNSFSLSANWAIILKTLFFDNPALLVASLLGAVVAFKKRGRDQMGNFLLLAFSWGGLAIFSVIFYHFPARYVMPAIPFLAAFASYFVFWLVEEMVCRSSKNICLVVLMIIILGFSVLASGLYSVRLLKTYSISQATEWFYQSGPSGSRVVSDVYLNANKASIEFLQKYNMYDWLDSRKKLLLETTETNYPQPNYFLIDTNLTDVQTLPAQERKADYGLISFYNQQQEEAALKNLDIFGRRELIFSLYPRGEKRYIKSLLNLEPHWFLGNIWSTRQIGPNVEIYKILK